MTDRRLPELIGICVLASFSCGVALAFDREFFAMVFATAAGFAVTQCAMSFGEGAGGEPEAPTQLGNNAAGLQCVSLADERAA